MKLALLAGVCASLLLYQAATAQAHYVRGAKRHNAYHAALYAWCGSNYRACPQGVKAFRVAGCETGGTYDRWARNGQYRGLWQLGWLERARCGQTLGRDPWSQARAAYCWWKLTSWGSWSCA